MEVIGYQYTKIVTTVNQSYLKNYLTSYFED